MDKIKIYIASADREIKLAVCDFASEFNYEVIGTSQYGLDTAYEISNTTPDVLVCSRHLFDMDACSLYTMLCNSGVANRCVVVIVGTAVNDKGINRILESGIDAYILLPFDYTDFDSRLRGLVMQKKNSTPKQRANISNKFNAKRVSALLHRLGLSSAFRGYEVIFDALMLAVDDPSILNSFTKKLYPELAKKHDTTPSNIECRIRYAIEKSWDKCDIETAHSMFGNTVSQKRGCPINSVYISTLVEYLKNEI